MEVHGIDMFHGAYKVSFRAEGRLVRGLVPESIIADWLRQSGRPEHGDAYEYIAAHHNQLEAAFLRLAQGKKVRPPFDRLSLMPEN